MSTLYVLEDEHFSLLLSKSGSKILCTGILDISLVLFYTPDCEYCPEIKECFKALSQLSKGVKFCVCNVKQCPNVVKMSKESTTVLQYVPYVLCFINGKPYAKYDGERSIKGIKDFIQQVHNKVEQFKKTPQLQQDQINGGEEVTQNTFLPQNRARRCYLTMDEAYSDSNNGTRNKQGGYQTFEQLYGQSLNGSGMDR